jgi:arginyl-tRNA--protein-N-Asp/Glu arginylyltransferase
MAKSIKFCRINLAKTNYSLYPGAERFSWASGLEPYEQIYQDYCVYKQFESVMPLFLQQFQDPHNDTHIYRNNGDIVAWSLCRRWDDCNAESLQFAWNYDQPELELGRRSLEHECAYYKQLGYEYLYLGQAAEYKTRFNGYEQLGKFDV